MPAETERRQYKNPPIKEAVCEFRFGPKQDWDPLLPGNLQQALCGLGDEYTGKALEQRIVSVGIETHEDKPPALKYDEGAIKVQLATEKNIRRIGVGRNVLTIHMLAPYQDSSDDVESGWPEFAHRIKNALSAYWNLVNPDGVFQVGIRYINEILIPEEEVEIDDYVKDALPRGEGIPDTVNGFGCRIEYIYDDVVRLALSQATLKPPPGHVKILLDLDVVWKSDELISQDESVAKAKDLRDRERTAFEAFITNKSRDLFDAD